MDDFIGQCLDMTLLAQRVALIALGLLVFINLICTANFMPTNAPFIFWMPVALACGGSIMMIHGAWFNMLQAALWAGACTAGLITILSLTLWWQGYHVSKHLQQIEVMKKLIEQTQAEAKEQAQNLRQGG